MYIIYCINFLMALATTIGMTIIPILATDNIGISILMLGVIEGFTEFLSNALRLFTGNLFDKIKNKKALFVVPIALSLLSKITLFKFNPIALLCSKTFERISNGAFAAPRDAYIGVNAENKGKSLGLLARYRSMGCILGPLLVSLLVYFVGSVRENIKLFIFVSMFTSVVALFLSFFITFKNTENFKNTNKVVLSFDDVKKVIKITFPILVLSALFYMSRFNDGVIILHLKDLGYKDWFYTSTIGIFNFFMFLFAPFIGRKIDQKKYTKMFLMVTSSMILFDICYLSIGNDNMVLSSLGLLFWGFQRVGSQLLFVAMIFKCLPKNLYGTGVGVFSLIQGLFVLMASTTTGLIINSFGFNYIYVVGLFFNVICILYYFSGNVRKITA